MKIFLTCSLLSASLLSIPAYAASNGLTPTNMLAEGNCPPISEAGLSVKIFYELGATRNATVRLTDGSELEQGPLEGWRIQENGELKLGHIQSYSGAWDRPGSYTVELLVGDKAIESQNVTVEAIGPCSDLESDPLTFTVKAEKPVTLNPNNEYYPLDGGSTAIRDSASGQLLLLTNTRNENWISTEVLRAYDEVKVQGSSVVLSKGLEAGAAGTTAIGKFHERGIDRGPLPATTGQITDYGDRYLYGILAAVGGYDPG